MTYSFRNILLIILGILFLSGCSITKRKYRKGYHLELSRFSNVKKSEGVLDSENNFNSNNELSFLTSSLEEQIDFSTTESFVLKRIQKKIAKQIHIDDSSQVECDNIILRSGEEISATVLEVGAYDIKYKQCENLDGPTFLLKKSKVLMIKYPNGTKTIFEQSNSNNNSVNPNSNNDNQLNSNQDYVDTLSSDDKSFLLTVGLWFLLGLIGVHRFYTGHIGIGIIYLLTFGLCGIGWLVDGILLLTGSYQPKKGVWLKE